MGQQDVIERIAAELLECRFCDATNGGKTASRTPIERFVEWARVSSREQREGYSIDAQLRSNREKAERAGWDVVREFVVAESAKRAAERTAFNEMYKWIRANSKRKQIEAILSHKLDRVCRNMRDAVCLQELEDTCGVKLAFVENQFGTGAAGALSFNVMAAVAQYYSDNLRSEVLKGMDEKVRQGWPTGAAPFGYMNVDDRNEPVQPDPDKSYTVHRIEALAAAVSDVKGHRNRQTAALAKRKAELANMQDRLLNAYLAGTLDGRDGLERQRTGPGRLRL